jgi:hypothetical protein
MSDNMKKANGSFGPWARSKKRSWDPAHVNTLETGRRLAITIAALGRFGEAEELFRTVIGRRRNSLGDDHPDTRSAIADLEALVKRQTEN